MSQIENVLHENRHFPPPREFAARARLSRPADYERMYAESIANPERFWGRIAREIPWIRPFERVLDWSGAPFAKWFVGGQINASAVCLDQHVAGSRAQKRAIVWIGEPGDTRTLTYTELHIEVCKFANALKRRGVKKGDRVAIYMPMVPETVVAMLACARVGAAHSVVFGGFSAQALRERVIDGGCTAVITADGSFRRGAVQPLKPQVDEAIAGLAAVHTVFVVQRAKNPIAWNER